MLKKILALLIALTSFNLFFYKNNQNYLGTIAFVILVLTTQAFLWIAFYQKDKKEIKHKFALVTSGLTIVTSIFSLFRASEVDQFLLSSLTLVLTLISTYLLTISYSIFGAISELFYVPKQLVANWLDNFFTMIPSLPRQTKKLFSLNKVLPQQKSPSKNTVFSLIRGAVITLPIILVITYLLAQADPVFSKLVNEILNIKINLPDFLSNIPERFIHSLILLLLLIPIAMLKIEQPFISPLKHEKFAKYKNELSVLVLSLVAVLAVFLAIQFRYLFANVAETQLHQFGINTYSEYVRKGFVEMLIVSVIVYLVSASSFVVYRSLNQSKNWLRRFNFLLLAEMLIFIISIFRRVLLYQNYHGLTRVRIYGSMFLIMLIGLTITLALRQIKKQFSNWYLYEIGIVIGTMLLSVFLKTDRLIATTFPPHVNNEIDYIYISRLSADGVDGWIKAYQDAKQSMEEIQQDGGTRLTVYTYLSISQLKEKYTFLIKHYGSKEDKALLNYSVDDKYNFTKFNFSEWQAYQQLKNNLSYNELMETYQKLDDIYYSLPKEESSKSFDRSLNSPLMEAIER